MLGNEHLQILMQAIKLYNTKRGRRLTGEETKEIQDKIINFFNKYNKVVNFIINNRLSLWIKETFYYFFGTPYPEYFYCKKDDVYLRKFEKTYPTKNIVLRVIKLLLKKELYEVRLGTASASSRALDVSKMFFVRKRVLLKDVNKFFNGEKEFKLKRIITYT